MKLTRAEKNLGITDDYTKTSLKLAYNKMVKKYGWKKTFEDSYNTLFEFLDKVSRRMRSYKKKLKKSRSRKH